MGAWPGIIEMWPLSGAGVVKKSQQKDTQQPVLLKRAACDYQKVPLVFYWPEQIAVHENGYRPKPEQGPNCQSDDKSPYWPEHGQ